jgi:hypothetical protein
MAPRYDRVRGTRVICCPRLGIPQAAGWVWHRQRHASARMPAAVTAWASVVYWRLCVGCARDVGDEDGADVDKVQGVCL